MLFFLSGFFLWFHFITFLIFVWHSYSVVVQGDTKKRELLKNPTKIEEIPPPPKKIY